MEFKKDLKANKKLSALFCAIMIVAIISTISRRSRVNDKDIVRDTETAASIDSSSASFRGVQRSDHTIVLHEEWGRDPFSSHLKTKEAKSTSTTGKNGRTGLILSGILTDGRCSRAVINGVVCAIDQMIAGYTIEEIRSGSVKLRKGNRILVLKL